MNTHAKRQPKPFLHHRCGWRNLFRRIRYTLDIFLRRESMRA